MIDLTNPEILGKIKDRAHVVVLEDDVREALIFVRNFKDMLAGEEGRQLNQSPAILAEYENILVKLRLVGLSGLQERELVDFFEKSIKDCLAEEELNILNKVTLRIIVVTSFAERDILKRKLREALYRNQQFIGMGSLLFDGEKVSPTVENWLKKYSQVAEAGIGNQIVQNEFLTTNTEVLGLTDIEKLILRKLISLFEYLKLSSQVPEGLEDPVIFNIDGQLKVLRQGNFEDIKISTAIQKLIFQGDFEQESEISSTSLSSTEQEVIDAYQGDRKQQKAIAKEIKKVDKKFGSSPEALRAEFFAGVQQKNTNRTVAVLMLMAQKDSLLSFIAQDEKLNKFLSAIWGKQYGPELVDDFKLNPNDVKYIKLFLQYVLEQRLGMVENDAARVGLQIGNAFAAIGKKSYNKMAYFDISTKKFNWFED